MIRKDYHIHSEFSGDSQQKIEDLIEHAIAIGLEEIALTDHAEYGANIPDSFILDLPSYVQKIQSLQESYGSQIQIRLGVEIGMDVNYQDYFDQILKSYPFDFIIASTHGIQGYDIGFHHKLREGKTKEEFQRLYFETLFQNIKCFQDYSVLGHLDFVTRYGGADFRGLALEENWDILQEILKYLVHAGKGLEINTSGFRYGEERFYPLPQILKEYRRLGGEILTLGSDAHIKEHLQSHFSVVEDFLHSINFPYLTSFEKQKAFIEKIR